MSTRKNSRVNNNNNRLSLHKMKVNQMFLKKSNEKNFILTYEKCKVSFDKIIIIKKE